MVGIPLATRVLGFGLLGIVGMPLVRVIDAALGFGLLGIVGMPLAYEIA
jgi:hypothetical protein